MSDIYDDPELRPQEGDFPPTVKFTIIGDRVRGVILGEPSKFIGKPRPDGSHSFAIKYRLGNVALSQLGKQARVPEAELLAGSKNLKGQLIGMRPRAGDLLDIELIEFKKSDFGSDVKIYKIIHEPAIPGAVAAQAPPPPSAPSVFDNGPASPPATHLVPPNVPVGGGLPRAAGDDEDDIFTN